MPAQSNWGRMRGVHEPDRYSYPTRFVTGGRRRSWEQKARESDRLARLVPGPGPNREVDRDRSCGTASLPLVPSRAHHGSAAGPVLDTPPACLKARSRSTESTASRREVAIGQSPHRAAHGSPSVPVADRPMNHLAPLFHPFGERPPDGPRAETANCAPARRGPCVAQ